MNTAQSGLTSLSDALDIAIGETSVRSTVETCPLTECYGRVLREDVIASVNVPSVDNSAMDGYAMRLADLPKDGGAVPVVGKSLAGHPYDQTLPQGAGIRIATGAAIPDGADCVIIQENVTANADETSIDIARDVVLRTKGGQNIRKAGEDIAVGQTILAVGHILRPQDVAIVAGQGIESLAVSARLSVAVFSTGDELAVPGAPLPPGGIYDSNRFAMIGMLRAIGCDVTDLGLLTDDFDVLSSALAEAAKSHDVIMTSGGVSVGKADLLKPVVDQLGEISAWKLAIKPGKPLMRGKIGDCVILGLPGNPVSVQVAGLLFAVPLLRHMMGAQRQQAEPARFAVSSAFDFRRNPGRREWLRARLVPNDDGMMEAHAFHSTSSGMLSSMVWAEGLVEIPEDCAHISKGDTVQYLPLRGLQ
ncbi:molybdopterin molybdotransferase MoeA [Thalassospira sp. MA62]|nr:molybdopterin molybdotransferase MoeA [Thalassospira sp. MA62]